MVGNIYKMIRKNSSKYIWNLCAFSDITSRKMQELVMNKKRKVQIKIWGQANKMLLKL